MGPTSARRGQRKGAGQIARRFQILLRLLVYDALGDLYSAVCAGLEHDDRRAVRRPVLDVKGLCPQLRKAGKPEDAPKEHRRVVPGDRVCG